MRAGYLGLLATFVAMSTVHAEEWLPVTPEELQLKSEPKAPAAPAVLSVSPGRSRRQRPDEVFYERIKILTDEGRKYGNVENPYVQGQGPPSGPSRREPSVRTARSSNSTARSTTSRFSRRAA
jgi:hypothetical protein